ncbi:MAG: hypothetical protein LBU46_02795 [Candidatus Accumulibacter sp.]|nr:hypothetical protein [Accumulibacter sp.]
MNCFLRSRLAWRFVALLLLPLPLPASAQQLGEAVVGEWIGLGRNENFRAYMDQRSVRRNGDFARVYQLTDFATAQWVDERTVVGSIRALVEYDCAQSRSRTLALEAYSEQMGEGRLIASEQKPDAEWENIASGGTSENVRQLVCGK